MKHQDKIYAVIDTNVIISSYLSKNGASNPAFVVNAIFEQKIIRLYNDEIINEYREVLQRSKFNFPKQIINHFLTAILSLGIQVEGNQIHDEEFPDPKDVVFYEVKMAIDDSYLVTGNIKHFPKIPLVVTPAQMVDILKEKGLIKK